MGKEITQTLQFLSRWHAGDQESLEGLLERHLPWIRSQVRHRLTYLLKSKGETCDFVQDAVLQFLRFAPRFTLANEAHFRAILMRVIENKLLDEYDRFTAKRRDIAREQPLPSDTILCLDPPENPGRTPSKSAEAHERESWIRLGMEFVDVDDREVLVLRQWDRMTFTEIGEQLNISSEAARKRHDRAVGRLADTVLMLRRGEIPGAIEDSEG
jgi:RNA polymerase sigma factor (sigma-70 family)